MLTDYFLPGFSLLCCLLKFFCCGEAIYSNFFCWWAEMSDRVKPQGLIVAFPPQKNAACWCEETDGKWVYLDK